MRSASLAALVALLGLVGAVAAQEKDRPAPPGRPSRGPVGEAPAAAARPATRASVVWYYVPAPCGPFGAGWYYRMPVSQPVVNGNSTGARPIAPGPLNVKALKAKDAPALYWQGHGLYWEGHHAAALVYLEAAAELSDDARYWYYRALAERELGKQEQARRSLQRAAELERQGKPRGDVLGLALERVQGPLRLWLREEGKPADRLAGP